ENLVDRFGLPLWRFCNSGTEATLEAARLMRAATGRDVLIKIEGTYHGHHDSLMFSVIPDPDLIGPREHPVTLPQALGIPKAFGELVRVVPFNDLAEVARALDEHEGNVAGMIVEPAMMNGGAGEAFGVTPDIVCLAKAIGGGLPCGAIGATEELFGPVVRGDYDMAGTFNGNPLTMAASRACLTEVLTRDAYEQFDAVHR